MNTILPMGKSFVSHDIFSIGVRGTLRRRDRDDLEPGADPSFPLTEDSLIKVFQKAERYVQLHFSEDIDYSIEAIHPGTLKCMTKKDFYLQYAYVVYNCGFRNSVVVAKWPRLREAYRDFHTVYVSKYPAQVYSEAIEIIAHKSKTKAIVDAARTIRALDWPSFKEAVKDDFMTLKRFPFIGDVTVYHLARNMGVDTIKPDVHLRRMAARYGLDPFTMCNRIHEETGLTLHMIDTIIWRASEQGII